MIFTIASVFMAVLSGRLVHRVAGRWLVLGTGIRHRRADL